MEFNPARVWMRDAYLSPQRLYGMDEICLLNGGKNVRRATVGGVYSSHGNLEPLSERVGGVGGDHVQSIAPIRWLEDQSEASTLYGSTAYLGPLHWHYGHFITEGLSRLWFALDNLRFDNYVYIPFSGHEQYLLDFHKRFLTKLGIPLEKVIVIGGGARLENAFIPEQLWSINSAPKNGAGRIYDYIRKPVSDRSGRFFLSRKQKRFKRVLNVSEVEKVFINFGFDVIYPEDFNLEDQLDIYSGAEIMAGFPGTAMHNILFSRLQTRLLEIGDIRSPHSFHAMQKHCNKIAGIAHHRVDFSGKSDEFDIHYLEEELSQLDWL